MTNKLERERIRKETAKPVKSGDALQRDQVYISSTGRGFKVVDHGHLKIIHQKGVGAGESPQRAVVDGRVKVFVRGNTIYTGNYGKKSKKVGTLVETPRWEWVGHQKPKKDAPKKGGKK